MLMRCLPSVPMMLGLMMMSAKRANQTDAKPEIAPAVVKRFQKMENRDHG